MRSHKTATVLLSLLLATTAYADDEVSEIDLCKDLSIIAREIMTARQMDKPLSETLPMALDRMGDMVEKYRGEMDSAEMKEMEEMFAPLVMAAYEVPSYGMEGLGRSEISEFENTTFAQCYEGMTSDSDE